MSAPAALRHELRRRHRRPAGTGIGTRLLLALIGLLGLGLAIYPMTASWFKQWQQSELVNLFTTGVDEVSNEQKAAEFDRAADYNSRLTTGIAYDPFTQRLAEAGSAAYREYLDTLTGFPAGLMGRIRIPEIEVDLPIYHGTTEDVLLEGVGHLYGTSLPVGGPGSHSVLTAHSGLASAVLFTNLSHLRIGDTWTVDVSGEQLTYRVVTIEAVLPHETESLAPTPGADLMTLVTCTPVGLNTHRLLVTGERIPNPPDAAVASQLSELPAFPWWIAWGVCGLAIAGLYLRYGGSHEGRHRIDGGPSIALDTAGADDELGADRPAASELATPEPVAPDPDDGLGVLWKPDLWPPAAADTPEEPR